MLELASVSKTYGSGLLSKKRNAVLKNVDFRMCRGEVVGITGSSGSGKTTMAKIAMRLVDPAEGAVLLDGSDITHVKPGRMWDRRRIQMIFQHPEGALDPEFRIRESLHEALLKSGVPKASLEDAVSECCHEFGISNLLMNRYPVQISGGEIQRVALARVMAFSPEYLFLDEPTSMLDLSVQAYILDKIMHRARKDNMAVALITHDFDILSLLTERLYFLDRGKMLAEGKTGNVFSSEDQEIKAAVDAWNKHKTMFFDCSSGT